MKQVAAHFGKEVLRDVTLEQIISDIPALRKECGDRAILRAIHYENENERVDRQAHALQTGDLDAFFRGVKQSGLSSFCYLQNVYTVKNVPGAGIVFGIGVGGKLSFQSWRGMACTRRRFCRNDSGVCQDAGCAGVPETDGRRVWSRRVY